MLCAHVTPIVEILYSGVVDSAFCCLLIRAHFGVHLFCVTLYFVCFVFCIDFGAHTRMYVLHVLCFIGALLRYVSVWRCVVHFWASRVKFRLLCFNSLVLFPEYTYAFIWCVSVMYSCRLHVFTCVRVCFHLLSLFG